MQSGTQSNRSKNRETCKIPGSATYGLSCRLRAKEAPLLHRIPVRDGFLSDFNSRACCTARRKIRCNWKAPRPRKTSAAQQNRPTFALPAADPLFVQQAFQLVFAAVANWTKFVPGTPVA